MSASVVRCLPMCILLGVAVVLTGCSHQALKVNCEEHLEAINAPAGKTTPGLSGPNSTTGSNGASGK
jgi:hypothetical protein